MRKKTDRGGQFGFEKEEENKETCKKVSELNKRLHVVYPSTRYTNQMIGHAQASSFLRDRERGGGV